jgi:hypothetical protein
MTNRANKRQQRKVNKQKQAPTKMDLSSWCKTVLKSWKLVLFFLGLLGTLSGILSLLPKISVEPSPPMQSNNLLTAPFVISNDGFLPMYKVSYFVKLRHIENAKGGKVITNYERGMEPSGFSIPSLMPGEKATTGLPNPFGEPTVSGDIDFVVTYRPSWLPWEQKKVFRFGGSKESDGKLVWRHRAASE